MFLTTGNTLEFAETAFNLYLEIKRRNFFNLFR